MAGTFDGTLTFSSGPARFIDGWLGQAFDYPFSGNNASGNFATNGVIGRGVTQRGRLVANNTTVLQGFITSIKAAADASRTGTLVSGDGRQWTNITILRVRFDDRVDHGRSVSLGYTIDYGEVV